MAEGTPGLSPPRAVTTSPSPTHCPTPQQSPFPRPCPVWPPPICSSPGEEEEAHHGAGKPRAELEPGRSQEKLFSCSGAGHRRDEPLHPTGTEPPWAGDTLCLVKCPAKHPLPGLWGPGRAAPAIRKCKKEKYNGKKRKLCLGSTPHPRETQFLPGKPLLPVFGARM